MYIVFPMVSTGKCRGIAKTQVDKLKWNSKINIWLIQKEGRKNRKSKTEGLNKNS